MGIFELSNNLKLLAINTQMVNQSSFGDIQLYNNRATVKYPYVNLDVVSARVNNYSKTYTFRIYVCDRNEPYIAYNKCELILDSIMKHHQLQADNYNTNFFTLNFKDLVNGCWADFTIETPLVSDCTVDSGDYNIILENNTGFVVDEDGNFIKQENYTI